MQTNQHFFIPLKAPLSSADYYYFIQKFKSFNAPRQFQRPIAWSASDRKKFFISLLMNRVEGTYVLVDVKACISRLETVGEYDNDTYKFFKKFLSAGYQYVVLDGNNRMCFVNSLFMDEYSIPEGRYDYISDEQSGSICSFVVRKGKQKFSDLPERVQDIIKERKAAVSLYTQISVKGMSEIFENVNSGVPLNAQELRNAFCTEWAEYVRNIADEVSSLLSKMFKDYRSRLKGEEWVVDCLDFVINGIAVDGESGEVVCKGVSQTTKNKLYLGDFLHGELENYYFDKFVDTMDFISQMIEDEILDEKCLVRSSAVQNLYWLMCNGVDTYEQAVSAVEMHEQAYRDKDRTYTCGDDEKTFKECCDGKSKENFEFRYIIFSEILDKISATVQAS